VLWEDIFSMSSKDRATPNEWSFALDALVLSDDADDACGLCLWRYAGVDLR
jgi:hypothetical protein